MSKFSFDSNCQAYLITHNEPIFDIFPTTLSYSQKTLGRMTRNEGWICGKEHQLKEWSSIDGRKRIDGISDKRGIRTSVIFDTWEKGTNVISVKWKERDQMHFSAFDCSLSRIEMAARYAANKQINLKRSEAAFRELIERLDCPEDGRSL